MGLLCQPGHLWILLCSQPGFGCVERVGVQCLNAAWHTVDMAQSCDLVFG